MENYERYVGQVFDGRYKILRIIGIGGMAVVFEAIDFATRRTVAVKMLKDDIAGDAQSVKRFINESKAVSMLNHPNIVKIFDVSVRENLKYIVMERVEGITLKNYITQKGALPLKEILNISEQILNALEHAHSKGIIHRDIKPQNIMLLKNGRIKVTDFGIAKLPNAETVTMTDKAIGTVFYISPEQASGKAIDPRSDLYSLGVVMYEMATGMLPFTADSPVSVALMQVSAQPKPPRERMPSIPVGLEQVILGAMEKKPERRFQSAAQLARHIAQLKANPGYVFKVRRSSPDQSPQLDKSATLPSEKQRRRRQSHSMLPIISGVSAAFMIVIVLAIAFIFTRLFEGSGAALEKRLTVDNFVGETYSEAFKAELEKSYYRVKVRMVYDSSYEENTIIGQTPDAGV
nr:serine/threonine protein kinase [Clostridia bacterium]